MNLNSPIATSRRWFEGYMAAWDRFWFTPRLPHTLAMLRIITGAMLLYSHLVLASDLSSFLGDHAWINNETARQLHDGAFGFSDLGRSYLWHLSSPLVLWLHHGLALLVTASFAVGFMTRISAPAAWFLQLMYLHRMTGHLFGLDQIVTYAAMYLMLAPCGSCFSLDAWLRKRLGERWSRSRGLRWFLPDASPSVTANVATRLFQLHLCVIYLFGGLAKARGQSWWDGTAMWYSVGNYEYQSIDMTWISAYPRLFSAMTHATLFWEIFYCALVWPRLTRPFVLAIAVAVHGGIAMFLGMITFGVMMIAANAIFIQPEWLLRWLGKDNLDRDQADNLAVDDEDDAGVDDGDDLNFDDEDDLAALRQTHAFSATDAELSEREESLTRRERSVRQASQQVKEKAQKLKSREEKYRDRVKRLKEREAKIKGLVERRRNANRK
jgi:hypothetical protein